MERLFITVSFLMMLTLVSCNQQFHCTFENQNFHLGRNGRPEPYAWGDEIAPLVFDSVNDFDEMMFKIDMLRAQIYEEYYLDTFEVYMDVSIELLKSDERTVKDFSNVYERKKTYPDSLGLLLKMYNKLAEVAGVQDHFYFGLGGIPEELNENQEDVIDFLQNIDLPGQFTAEFIIGVIKVSVENITGYITLDMQYPRSYNTHYVFENNESDTRLIGKSKTFIRLEKSSVLYVGRPLCSFTAVHTRSLLVYTTELGFEDISRTDGAYYQNAFLYANLGRLEGNSKRFRVGFESATTDEVWEYDFEDLESLLNSPMGMSVFRKAQDLLQTEDLLIRKVAIFTEFLEAVKFQYEI